MALTKTTLKRIIRRLLRGENYRVEIVSLIDELFLRFAIDFFKKVANAKLENREITGDWYKSIFLAEGLPKDDIAINSGLNIKTIHNSHHSSKKSVVITASAEHYHALLDSINELTDTEDSVDLNLTITFNNVSVTLNVSESLIVINAIAVKRAALRGGLWSTVGKSVEKPLMETLCKLYSVQNSSYRSQTRTVRGVATFSREVDFYLIRGNEEFKCEVKLMGRGNPEGADAAIARDSHVFVADTLSDTNKNQLNSIGVEWVELRTDHGFRRFKTVLENLQIPHQELDEEELESNIDSILEQTVG